MTYCVGLKINKGLVFLSDTRTNAGVDKVSRFRKMKTWEVPGERVITLLSAGNLATTQAVISRLEERTKVPSERQPSVFELPTVFQIAELVGRTLRDVIREAAPAGQEAESLFEATLILGGQISGIEPRLFLVYPEGNFIEASEDTPYFQIGETKYGRPILVRAYEPDMSFEDAVKLLCVSFDSTMKANLSVGMPLDLQVIERGTCRVGYSQRIEEDDAYFRSISVGWGEALKQAFHSLPDFEMKRPG